MQIKIFLPLYNVERWIETTFNSLKSQTFQDYKAFFLDDCSNDKTSQKIKNLICEDQRFTLVTNQERLYSIGNLWHNVSKRIDDDDYIIILDGDDWFFNNLVLEKIYNKAKEGFLFIHGQFIEFPKMLLVDERGYSDVVKKEKAFRQDRWRCSGIRAFKGSLWKKIKLEDITDNGEFYRFTADQAYTFPLLESASELIYRFDEPIHVYNKANPINDDKVSREMQLKTELKIRNMSYQQYINMMKGDNLILRKMLK